MNKKLLVGVIVLLAGFGVGWFVLRGAPSESSVGPTPAQSPDETVSVTPIVDENGTPVTQTGETTDKGGVPQAATATASYTDSGFTPSSITVKKGTTVRFTNQSSRNMWVASGTHPTHQLLPGFDQLKAVGKGGTYDYTFAKVGTWQYHNHTNETDMGYVVVTE